MNTYGAIAPEISVVVPAHNESGNLAPLSGRLSRVLNTIVTGWEIVLVDDGSTDQTWEQICELHAGDDRIRGVRLSRNFGHQSALLAGLSCARGHAVISMDADLQHPPELIPELVHHWRNGIKIVHTARIDSQDATWAKRTTSRFFYRILSYLSEVQIEPGMADFRLLDRQVADQVLDFRESSLFLRGIVHWVGYPAAVVNYQADKRLTGASKYSLRKMFAFARCGFISFSANSLRLAILLGVITSLASFAELVYAVAMKVFTGSTVPGWASLASVMSLFFGILFILFGIIGEYIAAILTEVRARPRFIVSELIGAAETNGIRRANASGAF